MSKNKFSEKLSRYNRRQIITFVSVLFASLLVTTIAWRVSPDIRAFEIDFDDDSNSSLQPVDTGEVSQISFPGGEVKPRKLQCHHRKAKAAEPTTPSPSPSPKPVSAKIYATPVKDGKAIDDRKKSNGEALKLESGESLKISWEITNPEKASTSNFTVIGEEENEDGDVINKVSPFPVTFGKTTAEAKKGDRSVEVKDQKYMVFALGESDGDKIKQGGELANVFVDTQGGVTIKATFTEKQYGKNSETANFTYELEGPGGENLVSPQYSFDESTWKNVTNLVDNSTDKKGSGSLGPTPFKDIQKTGDVTVFFKGKTEKGIEAKGKTIIPISGNAYIGAYAYAKSWRVVGAGGQTQEMRKALPRNVNIGTTAADVPSGSGTDVWANLIGPGGVNCTAYPGERGGNIPTEAQTALAQVPNRGTYINDPLSGFILFDQTNCPKMEVGKNYTIRFNFSGRMAYTYFLDSIAVTPLSKTAKATLTAADIMTTELVRPMVLATVQGVPAEFQNPADLKNHFGICPARAGAIQAIRLWIEKQVIQNGLNADPIKLGACKNPSYVYIENGLISIYPYAREVSTQWPPFLGQIRPGSLDIEDGLNDFKTATGKVRLRLAPNTNKSIPIRIDGPTIVPGGWQVVDVSKKK